MSLEELSEKVTVCTDCELCKTRTKSVPGKGNPNADIVFIGEAPGRSEDLKGEPFVGAAGTKLSTALSAAGLSRDDVYITNVAKCRPPNNRVPSKDEKEACRKYLDAELEIINPKVICVMGNTAYESILGGSEITKNRGTIIKQGKWTYFVTIHPAATIYNQKLIPVLEQDMKKLAEFVA